MILITGAAGFIGSCLVSKLNREGYMDLVVVDDFSNPAKNKNLEGKKFSQQVHRDRFGTWLRKNHRFTQFVFHIGARTDTTLFDRVVFDRLNLNFSKDVWNLCVEFGLPLVYASSAATYGSGDNGYEDNHSTIPLLKPMNPYGESKHEFDKWVLAQEKKPYFWTGLKFFNVYGPNEYHKGRMASVVFHTYHQIRQTGYVNLFRSHNPKYKDGEQLRDFISIHDVTDACFFLLHHRTPSTRGGIYNLGTGKARTFIDLATTVFRAMNLIPDIRFIDTPSDIRDKYQYFTEARMDKLRSLGYHNPFTSLEEGISGYVRNFLITGRYY